jgi:hypothetical protein
MEASLRLQPVVLDSFGAATQAGRAGSRQLTFRHAGFERPADEDCQLIDSLTLSIAAIFFRLTVGTK